MDRVLAGVGAVGVEDPRAHHRAVAVPVDAVGLDPGLDRGQDRGGQYPAPVGDDTPQSCTVNHDNNFRRQFVGSGNVACRVREGSVTSQDARNVGGLRYNRVQPESMRMPLRAFADVRILRTGRRNMPSARTPDPAPAGSSPSSITPPSPAGKAGPLAGPLAVPPAGPPSAGPPPSSSPTDPLPAGSPPSAPRSAP